VFFNERFGFAELMIGWFPQSVVKQTKGYKTEIQQTSVHPVIRATHFLLHSGRNLTRNFG
jgi:hypothetical protein